LRRSRYRIAWVFFALLFAALLSGAWLYTSWKSSQTVLPPGLTINGLPMGGMTRDQALTAIELAYTRPVTVYYANRLTPLLLPEMIELTLNVEETTKNLDEAIAFEANTQSFVTYALDLVLQRESEAQGVHAVVDYSRERIDAFLTRTAQKYDHLPQEAVSLPEAGTFRPPQDGTKLDAEASLPLLIDAILAADPAKREVHLVVEVDPVPAAAINILEQAIAAALDDFSGVAGIFAKDLQHGREVCINCYVAFSALSLPKVAIALEQYRLLDTAPDVSLTDSNTVGLIKTTLIERDNVAANRLLAQIGAGNPYSGALQVTDLLWSLGLTRSFIVGPYETESIATPPDIAGLASAQSDIFTDPDPARQTTPTEMGLLLEGVYQCARDGGVLRAVYPQTITPGECEAVLTGLEDSPDNALASAGMPPEIRVAHRHGWSGATHADLTLVYGTQADFVVALFLYQPEWLVWDDAAPTFATLGQLTYRFFNGED